MVLLSDLILNILDSELSSDEKFKLFLECNDVKKYKKFTQKDRILEIKKEFDEKNFELQQKNQSRKKRKLMIEKINQSDDKEKKIFSLNCNEDNKTIIFKKFIQYEKASEHDKSSLNQWLEVVLNLPYDSPSIKYLLKYNFMK